VTGQRGEGLGEDASGIVAPLWYGSVLDEGRVRVTE